MLKQFFHLGRLFKLRPSLRRNLEIERSPFDIDYALHELDRERTFLTPHTVGEEPSIAAVQSSFLRPDSWKSVAYW